MRRDLEEVHKQLAQTTGRLSLLLEVGRVTKRDLLEILAGLEQVVGRMKDLLR